jgi:Zn-dependent protease with chaperone function
MTQDDFERASLRSLVRRLEHEAAANPASYRRKLGALAFLGYAYIAATVLLLVGGAALIVWMAMTVTHAMLLLGKVGWAFLVLIYVVVRAMWVRLDPPHGRPLTSAESPELFRLIDSLRVKGGAPRVDHVLLTGDFNAAIVQHPRFGIFGGTRNYLMLGLPLMQSLSLPEFEAVVAHEFGHLSGEHGRFGAWIYRLRTGWARLLSALQAHNHWGSALFTRFFNWYAPLFGAYSFVQARQQEYEADRMSVAAVGREATASALLRVNMQGEFLAETFWPAIFKRADADPAPPMSPFSILGPSLKLRDPTATPDRMLAKALAQRTGYGDTHPCLADRLKAIAVEPYVPTVIDSSAAEALLGATMDSMRRELDERWRSSVKQWWDRRHQYASESRARLAMLEQKVEASEPLSAEELWDRARFTEEFGSSDAALALYEQLLEHNPQHVGALWRRGQLLLARDDPQGIDPLSAAARIDRKLEQPACAAVVGFHRRHGRELEAKEYEKRYWELSEQGELVRRERAAVRSSDRLMPHGLEPALLAGLVDELRHIAGVRRALLVRKALKYQPERALFVLGVFSDAPWWRPVSRAAEKELVARISRECHPPGDVLIISLRLNAGFRGLFGRVCGSEIFRRRPPSSRANGLRR